MSFSTRHKLTDCLPSASAYCGDRIGSYYMFGVLLNLLANLEFQRGKMGVRQETFSFKGEANRAKEQKGAWALIEVQIQISIKVFPWWGKRH